MICTFFGHRDCPKEIEPLLRETIQDLIENKGVTKFYVGNHGNFDFMVQKALEELAGVYPIEYGVVLAYMPSKKEDTNAPQNTLVPEGIELVPPRFAVSWRNRWMIRQADYVITFVTHPFGGAAQFKAMAERQNKIVINLKTA